MAKWQNWKLEESEPLNEWDDCWNVHAEVHEFIRNSDAVRIGTHGDIPSVARWSKKALGRIAPRMTPHSLTSKKQQLV